MHIVSTNFAKALLWKHEYDVKLWRHKQRTPNTNDHHVPLNETPPVKIFCVRHWGRPCRWHAQSKRSVWFKISGESSKLLPHFWANIYYFGK